MPDTGDSICNICHESETLLSVGVCDHHVCYKCATRMRVLMGHQYCPICRTELPKIIFSWKKQRFADIVTRTSPEFDDAKYGISFEDKHARNKFEELLSHCCRACDDGQSKPFGTFDKLQEHIRRVHQRFYCDICVDHLKLFSFERKSYARPDLALHKRKGDPDDTSHKGHPLCEYCDKRFLDNDELWRHLRKDHYFCHFCDADGKHLFFESYPHVLVHFRQEHHVCEEGDCASVQFTNVFRTDIDLRAHKTQQHLKNLSKSEQKQVRTLELQFNFGPPRHRSAGGASAEQGGPVGDDRPKRGGSGASSRGVSKSTAEEDQLAVAVRMSTQSHEAQKTREAEPLQFNTDDFPDLAAGAAGRPAATAAAHQKLATAVGDGASGAVGRAPVAATSSMAKRFARSNRFTVVEDDCVDGADNHFPALPSTAATAAVRPMPSAMATKPQARSGPVVNTPAATAAAVAATSTMSTTAAASVKKNAWSSLDDEFPALPPAAVPAATAGSVPAGWTKISKGKAKRDSMSSQKPHQRWQQQQLAEVGDDFPSLSHLAAELASGAVLPSGRWAAKDGPAAHAATAAVDQTDVAVRGLNGGETSRRAAGSSAAPAAAASVSGTQAKNKKKKKKGSAATDQAMQQEKGLERNRSQQQPAVLAAASAGCASETGAAATPNVVPATALAGTAKTSNVSASCDGSSSASPQLPKAVEIGETAGALFADAFPALPTGKRPCGPPPGFTSPAEPVARPPPGLTAASSAVATASSLADIASFISPLVVPALGAKGSSLSSTIPLPPGLSLPVPVAQPSGPERSLVAEGGQQRGVTRRMPNSGLSAVQQQHVGSASTGDGTASCTPQLAFVKPGDFDVRNAELTRLLKSIVVDDPGKLDLFVTLTSRFRGSLLGPRDFYECCLVLLGETAFARLFPELLVLLPDTVKQSELLAAHAAFVAEPDGSRTALAALSTDDLFSVCPACGQVLARRDTAAHDRHHAATRFDMAEQVADFPPLSAPDRGGVGVLRNWAKKS